MAAKTAVGRYAPISGTLGDGRVLIAGGYNEAEKDLRSAELFNPANNTFEVLTAGHEMVEKRDEAAHVSLANGNVLVLGGFNAAASNMKTAEEFNFESETFQKLPVEMVEPRDGPAAALLANGQVLIAAGYNDITSSH